MQEQLNPYNEEEFQKEFEKTKIYKQLKDDFDLLIFDKTCPEHRNNARTPRQTRGDRSVFVSQFYTSAFYYLNYLLNDNPREIYDIGCGWNIFQKYIPEIIGISPEDITSDLYYGNINEMWGDTFVNDYVDFFEHVFSICSLHFRPIEELKQLINDLLYTMVPGGICYLSLNVSRMIELTKDKDLKGMSAKKADVYVREQLADFPAELLVFDVDFKNGNFDNTINGNINIVFRKNK